MTRAQTDKGNNSDDSDTSDFEIENKSGDEAESDLEMDEMMAFENKTKTFFNIVKKSSLYRQILMYTPIYTKDIQALALQNDIQFDNRIVYYTKIQFCNSTIEN